MLNLKRERGQAGDAVLMGIAAVICVFLAIGVILGVYASVKVVGRYQSRADRNQNRTQARYDASNRVRVNNIRISYFEQEKKIESQRAQIRFIQSTGIRKSQDEIAKTLTPLYVQFEMVQALQAIARSGRNSSVIYIPSGPAGIPFIQGAGSKVGATNK